jgi:uncharacterized protein
MSLPPRTLPSKRVALKWYGPRFHLWGWAVLVQLAFAISLPAVQAQQSAADEGGSSLPSNGGYLSSRLMPAKPENSCSLNTNPTYQADVIVTGTDMRQRPWGFARTLREVLVKSSGDPRLKDDPRAAALGDHADRFVGCFNYIDLMAGVPLHDDQGTSDRPHKLTVSFVPAKIDAILARFGDKPWRSQRPVIVPVLLVNGRKPPPYVLSAEIAAGADQRAAFATAAGEFGMRVRIPSDIEIRGWNAKASRIPSQPPASNIGEAIVIGTLDWSEALPGWTGHWRMQWRGVDYVWGIKGVNYDAAFRNIVRGVMLVASGSGPPDQGD